MDKLYDMAALMSLFFGLITLAVPPSDHGTPATTRPTSVMRTAAIRPMNDLENLDAMERELKLSGEELARFRETAEAERAALAEWTAGEKGKEFSALAKARAVAVRSKDLETAKKLWEQMRPLSGERTEIRREKRADVLERLSPASRRKWAGYVLYARVAPKLKPLGLTEEQWAAVRKIADEHAAPAVDPDKLRQDPFLRSLTPLGSAVINEARDRVLTLSQIDQLRANRSLKASTSRPSAAPVEKE